MAFKIGFLAEQEQCRAESAYPAESRRAVGRKSVVQVKFPDRGSSLAYYNDRFDLKRGDLVFVDGKLEGQRGRVTDVNYNFKIKLSDYKRVISVADTEVHGEFFMGGSHFVSFERDALPMEKARSWYLPPKSEDEVYERGFDREGFQLVGLRGFDVNPEIAERGGEYYMHNKVVYLCVDEGAGYAIVNGSRPYEIEFNYDDGEISALCCSCFCSYNCKHEVAALMQLRETLKLIEENYADSFEAGGYFAAVSEGEFFATVIDGKERGSLRV